MPLITIVGTPINFPDDAQSPDWAPPVIQFAEVVEQAFTAVIGPFDIVPQVYSMVANINNNVSIPSFQFPVSEVRAAFVRYSVFRTTNTSTAYEAGNMTLVYNPNNPVNSKWEIQREYIGNGDITFTITDLGQIEFSSTSLSGINHSGNITFAAQALLQS